MLPIGLVLLVASSAIAAPVILNQFSENEIQDNSLVTLALNVVDGGDANAYTLNMEEILREMASQPAGAARSYGQTIALLGLLSYGRPGDACAAAELINAYVENVNVRQALANYVGRIVQNIDHIVQRAVNPDAARFSVGPISGCAGQGRSYQFEAAWQRVLNTAQVLPALIQEEYCVAKRMYHSVDARTNVAGAILTAGSLEPSVYVFQRAGVQLENLLRALATRTNLQQAAYECQQALISAV